MEDLDGSPALALDVVIASASDEVLLLCLVLSEDSIVSFATVGVIVIGVLIGVVDLSVDRGSA